MNQTVNLFKKKASQIGYSCIRNWIVSKIDLTKLDQGYELMLVDQTTIFLLVQKTDFNIGLALN